MDPKTHSAAKGFLIFISLLVGLLAWSILAFDITEQTKRVTIGGGCAGEKQEVEKVTHRPEFNLKGSLIGVPIGLFVAFLYPVIAALIIRLCEEMKSWAYCGQVEEWDRDFQLFLGAFWPLTLICCIIVCLFLGIIHRIF